MPEGDPPGGGRDDYHYFGPFGNERTAPLGIGQWSEPGPAIEDSPPVENWGGALFPAPPGVVPLRPRPPEEVAASFPPPRTRRPLRGASVVLVSALTALVMGTAAGFGGAKLAQRGDATPPTTVPTSATSPTSPPSPTTPDRSAPPVLPGRSNTVEVAKAVLPSSVMIRVGNSSGGASGSGFVLDNDGRIMTNNHVVAPAAAGARIQVVFADGTRTAATLVGRSPSYDLAVIKVSASSRLKPIQIGDSDASQVGETVIAVGSPLGLPGTVTGGIVSAKNRPVVVTGGSDADAPSAYINAIQTDAPINPGNSGGPLVDSRARVIGVNSAILTLGASRGQAGSIGLGFAIPINQAMEIGNQLIKQGKAAYPVIGANVSNSEGEDGVELTSVEPGGPAADAGLREGDVITSIDGEPVRQSEQLIVTIRTHRPGEEVELTYRRGGSEGEAKVRLGGKEG